MAEPQEHGVEEYGVVSEALEEAATMESTAADATTTDHAGAERRSMYGYEDDADQPPVSSGSSRMTRRNVVKGEEVLYEMSYHPGRVLAYSPPRQRQKWGETQSLPRVNWGDLFFDLHYVAATYNISYQLVNDPTLEGLLYAAGTFFPIQSIWTRASVRSSRFVTEDDLFHRALQIFTLLILATAVLHIRPLKIMSQPSKEISMFVFSLCLVLDLILEAIRTAETYFFGVGQKQPVKNSAVQNLYSVGILFCFYGPALVLAALEFFPRSGDEYRRLAEDSSSDEDAASFEADTEKASANHIPIILLLVGYWFSHIFFGLRVIYCFPKNGRHKEFVVPINVGFYIHRVGEWTMLMLGESVFSLLVVDVPNENGDFFSTFYAGIGTVILLQILTFQSQPHDANFHALRRNKDAGIGWGYLITIYSFALVCLGAAFTFFLQDFSFEEEARRLAAVTASSDRESDRERSAHLFCGALAVAFASLDGMTLFHLGIKESMSRLKSREKTNIAGLVILGFRLAVIPFTATVSQWETEPAKLSMIGLVCVLVQLVLRKLGAIFLSHDQVYALDPERSGHKMHHDVPKRGVSAAAWPNVTQAQAEPSKAISESD